MQDSQSKLNIEKFNEEDFKNIVVHLTDSYEQEVVQDHKYDEIKKYLNSYESDNIEDLNTMIIFPLNMIIKNWIGEKGYKHSEKVSFICINYSFFERNLEEIIRNKESFVCVADKTRWLINSYVKYLETDKEFDMTITDKCYWKPSFGTAKQWIDFIKSLHSLYRGKSEDFIKIRETLINE